MISAAGRSCRTAQTSMSRMTQPLNRARRRMIRVTIFCSELTTCALCTSSAVWPKWVRGPVARTSAIASPRRTSVPANVSVPLLPATGSDSPVSIDWSSRTSPSPIRTSAGTTAPSMSLIVSPGTSSSAGMMRHTPARRTDAFMASRARSCRSVASALPSWRNAKATLNARRAAITSASTISPSSSCSSMAASSSQGTGDHRPARTRCQAGTLRSGMLLGPTCCNLRAASARLKPSPGRCGCGHGLGGA